MHAPEKVLCKGKGLSRQEVVAFNKHGTKVSMVSSHKTEGKKRQGLIGWRKGEVHRMGQLSSRLNASVTQMYLTYSD